MRKVKVAATQMSCSGNIEENISRADALVRQAAAEGA
ncbi:MAG: amidohydrolase, partial [Paenibacillus sp.]|nr:amidohydrolase [Paenibacillus sp.]